MLRLDPHLAFGTTADALAHPACPVPIIPARKADQPASAHAALHFPMEPALYAAIGARYPAPPQQPTGRK